ncbi:MAG: hypothetical protein AB7S67_12270 [Thiomonas sp.]
MTAPNENARRQPGGAKQKQRHDSSRAVRAALMARLRRAMLPLACAALIAFDVALICGVRP